MYDGSTACWEAIGMARRITRRSKAILSSGLHPHYVSVANTMARFTGDVLDTALPELGAATDAERLIARIDGETSAVVVQYPDILGRIADLSPIAEAAHAAGALLIAVVTEPVALGLIKSPGEMGADIVVGEGQSIGVGLQFGGPYVGLFACREKHVRQMPGRLAGETVDAEGKRGFVLTLSTREQHIRREKATSNICTNSGLCALAFSVHMSLLGERGLRRLAEINHGRAVEVAERLAAIPGIELVNDSFFNEFTVRLPVEARPAVRALADRGILGGVSLGRLYPGVQALEKGLVVAVTETVTDADVDAFEAGLKEVVR
jgi:glycine dehydrogenase subunit 1